jgi:hypothetical protein
MHGMNNINDLGQCRNGHITSTTHVSEEDAAAGRLFNFHATGYYAPDDRYVMHGTERALSHGGQTSSGVHTSFYVMDKKGSCRGEHIRLPLVPTLNEIRPVHELPSCF